MRISDWSSDVCSSDLSAADQKRLHDAILAAIDHDVRPAYAKLGKFVADDYAPHGRSQPGVWDLPNGEAIYRFQVEQMTRSEGRRVGKECVSTCRSRGSTYH